MGKLLLGSVLIATVLLPMLAARERSPMRGLRKLVATLVAFNIFYLFAVLYLYPRLG